MSMNTNLSSLEEQLDRAKQSGDANAVRELIPAVNAARRAFREFAEAFAEQQARKGVDLDGEPLTPDQKLVDAIFGVDKSSKDLLRRLQERWENGLTLDPPEEEEAVSYASLADNATDGGRYIVEIWMTGERFQFGEFADAREFVRRLPVHAEVRDLGAPPVETWFFQEV